MHAKDPSQSSINVHSMCNCTGDTRWDFGGLNKTNPEYLYKFDLCYIYITYLFVTKYNYTTVFRKNLNTSVEL